MVSSSMLARRVALAVVAVALTTVTLGACLPPAAALGRGPERPNRVGHAQPLLDPSRARLIKPVCEQALDPPARVVSVTAVMRPLAGTQKLSIEFQLLERSDTASGWTQLSAPGLGTWLSPTNPPTLGQRAGDVWIVNKPVANLDAPASYRFAVTFRWTGADGAQLASTTLLGKVCHQGEQRADLVVDSVSVIPVQGSSGLSDYAVTIANTGATGAGQFAVQLREATAKVDLRVAHLGPHRTARLVFRAQPTCSASEPATVTVDPYDQIDVSSRSQATLAALCPAP